MKIWHVTLLTGLLLGTVSISRVAAGEIREWTGARNLRVRGELVALKDNQVVIRNEEGRLVEIPLMQLGSQDQLYVRRLAMQPQALPGRASSPAAVQTNVLPPFTEGKWKGYHAFYEHPKMTVLIDTRGYIVIQPKDNDRPVGPPIPCSWGILYCPAPGEFSKGRSVIYYDAPPPPTVFKKQHGFKGVAQDQVKFAVEIECENNTAEFKFEFYEPANVIHGLCGIAVTLYSTHSFPDGTPLEKIAKALTGYSLVFKQPKGPEIKYDYHPHVTLTEFFVSATIKGPWGPRVVTIEQKRGALHLGNYPLTPLYGGYNISKMIGAGPGGPGIRFTVE